MKTSLLSITGIAVITLCASACSNNEITDVDSVIGTGKSVVFTSDEMTRATDMHFETGDQVGIYASTSERGEILPSGNYASNVKYVFNNNRFIPSADGIPLYNGDIWAINYYAVYPYRDNQSVSFTFTVGEDQSTHANYTKNDLMLGYNASTTADVIVPLNFRHMLCQVVIDASDAELTGNAYSLVFLSDVDKVTANIAKLTAVRTEQGTKPLDIIMCNDGLDRYKAVMPPQRLVNKSVAAYVRINGKTHLARLEKDVNLHSGKSVEFKLLPVEDSSEYVLRQQN